MHGKHRHSLLAFLAISLAVVFCVSSASPAFAAEKRGASATLTILSEKPFMIGDPVDVALTVYHPKDEAPVLPGEKDFSPFILRSGTVKKKRSEGNMVKTLAVYTLALYETGTFEIPPLEVAFGETLLRTKPLKISILSVLPPEGEEAELRDITPPYPARMRPFVVLGVFLALAAGSFLLLFLLRLFMKRRARPAGEGTQEPVFDPYEISMGELESLKRSYTARTANEKKAYSTLSHALRLYFGSLLEIRALDMTTSEIRRIMRMRKQPSFLPKPAMLLNLLRKSDMVKFARERPRYGSVEEDIDGSISIIRETRTRTEEAGEAGHAL